MATKRKGLSSGEWILASIFWHLHIETEENEEGRNLFLYFRLIVSVI